MSTDTAKPGATILDLESLDEATRTILHRTASRIVVASVNQRTSRPSSSAGQVQLSTSLFQDLGRLAPILVMGLFVTLKRSGHLRGCCGVLGRPIPIHEALATAGYRTACEDLRMPAISPSELPFLSLDLTVLGPLESLVGTAQQRLDGFELGKHGLRIQSGTQAGLLLPSVPVEQGWDRTEFLSGVCRKAGLPEDAWRSPECDLSRFAGATISGCVHPDDVATARPAQPLLTATQMQQMRALVANNILSLLRGATPTYVAPMLPDGTVNGLVLSLYHAASQSPLAHLMRMSLRPGVPLQSTLFELSQAAAQALKGARPQGPIELDLVITVLQDPASHGQVTATADRDSIACDECHLEGIQTDRRAIVGMLGGSRIAVELDPEKTPTQLATDAVSHLSGYGRVVTIYSMDAVSTLPRVSASSAPKGQSGPGIRPPYVAGAFYEADDDARIKQVDSYLSATTDTAVPALAVMVPHAGLRYCGAVAARAWKGTRIPSRILIIGPKHTSDGVDWAVAPYRRWSMSESSALDSDLELTEKIANEVPGMQIDAAAHQREHGIEVLLPFVHRLAPDTKITAIAMHGASWPDIELASKQLAKVLLEFDEIPLLVISSDMNHYASDPENRRRDRLALDALQTGDPRRLLDVCQRDQISMCGVLPAALVMQTLHELVSSFTVREMAYATSADVSGDASRVVGYASVQFLSGRGAT